MLVTVGGVPCRFVAQPEEEGEVVGAGQGEELVDGAEVVDARRWFGEFQLPPKLTALAPPCRMKLSTWGTLVRPMSV